MLIRRKKREKKKLTAKVVIHRILHVVIAVLILYTIPLTAELSKSYFRMQERMEPYDFYDLYTNFVDRDYEALFDKIAFNRGLGETGTEEDQEFYAFANCYNAAVDYQMYTRVGDTSAATVSYKTFQESEKQLHHQIFLDALQDVKETYELQ